jgi:hypothetical protein
MPHDEVSALFSQLRIERLWIMERLEHMGLSPLDALQSHKHLVSNIADTESLAREHGRRQTDHAEDRG